MNYKRGAFIVLLLSLSIASPTFAQSYGARETISFFGGLPAGWFVLSENTIEQTENIEYLVGGPYGAIVDGLGGNLPSGWVVVQETVENGNAADVTEVVECLNGGPYDAIVNILADSPAPKGWCIVAENLGDLVPTDEYWTIVNLNGAGIGAKATILSLSKIPAGWYLLSQSPGDGYANDYTWLIENVGAYPTTPPASPTFGEQVQLAAGSVLPSGWYFLSGNVVYQTVEYLGGAAYGAVATIIFY